MVTLLAVLTAFVRVNAEQPAKKEIDGNSAAFCVDLYKQLAKKPGNHFFSPFSIVTALAMTSAGSAGATDAEMAAVLRLNPDPVKRHAECASWARMLNSANGALFKRPAGGMEISTANSIWLATRLQFKKTFVEIAKNDYDAEVRAADFAGNSKKAVKDVNDWVENKTKGKIKDIVDVRAIPPDTALILANAIYFKADWASPFKNESTHDADFTLEGGEKIKAPLMSQTTSFNYVNREAEGFAALEMPYKDGRMTMLVLLPHKIDGLAGLEKKLTGPLVIDTIESMKRERVMLYLPKFHAETEYQLADTLSAMGMKLAFTPSADFSGITDVKPTYISAVIHKAFVDVDEKGTEAAAATVVGIRAGSAAPPKPPAVFRADHPFIYFIRDTQTGQILFAGRMADPRK